MLYLGKHSFSFSRETLLHDISVIEMGHLLTHSCLTYPEVSSKVCHDSFCQLGNSVSLPWVIYYEAFYLHVVSSFSCIPVICLKLVLFLIPLQFVYSFCNLSECIVLFFSCLRDVSDLILHSLFFYCCTVHVATIISFIPARAHFCTL